MGDTEIESVNSCMSGRTAQNVCLQNILDTLS